MRNSYPNAATQSTVYGAWALGGRVAGLRFIGLCSGHQTLMKPMDAEERVVRRLDFLL